MNIQEFFPKAIRNGRPQIDGDWISIEQETDFIHIPIAALTEREEALLKLVYSWTDKTLIDDPWSQYLKNHSSAPQRLESAQLIYIDHTIALSDDLVELLRNLLPNYITVVPLAKHRTVLVLNQEIAIDVEEVIKDTLPTIESDFGLRLTIFFGNTWTRLQEGDLPLYFQEENQLFSAYLKEKRSSSTMTFSKLVLWGLAHQVDVPCISQKLLQWIDDNKDMRDVIRLLWETHGNLVQTAQLLFMHRNSLQYKLEKFTALSGLNLKNLDDLAICYLLLLKE